MSTGYAHCRPTSDYEREVVMVCRKLRSSPRPSTPLLEREASSPNQQAPEKPQIPSSKAVATKAHSATLVGTHPAGVCNLRTPSPHWSLVLLWSLGFGILSFSSGPPKPAEYQWLAQRRTDD